MGELHFHVEDVEQPLDHPSASAEWIRQIIFQRHFNLDEINFIFCSDPFLLQLNVEYLDHDTFTDIITFDLSEGQEKRLCGDIYISVDRVKENANSLGVDFNEEIHRVMIHGILHLLGYEDKTQAQKEAMRKKEEACLSLRPLTNQRRI